MNLAGLLGDSVVKVPLEGMTKDEVIAELGELLVRSGAVKDRGGMLDALMAREEKGSTGIGDGIAIPHARSVDVETVALAIGVSREGVEFDAVDDEPVHLVFLLMAAAGKPSLNVEALADIGSLVQIPGVYDKIAAAPNAQSLINIIEEAQNHNDE